MKVDTAPPLELRAQDSGDRERKGGEDEQDRERDQRVPDDRPRNLPPGAHGHEDLRRSGHLILGRSRLIGSGLLSVVVRRRDVLYEGLTSIPGVFLCRPEGAFYCMAKLPVESAEDFAIYLLGEFEDQGETVMVAPGQGFYSSPLGRDEIRIAYVLKEPALRRSVELLRLALERYKQRG